MVATGAVFLSVVAGFFWNNPRAIQFLAYFPGDFYFVDHAVDGSDREYFQLIVTPVLTGQSARISPTCPLRIYVGETTVAPSELAGELFALGIQPNLGGQQHWRIGANNATISMTTVDSHPTSIQIVAGSD